MAVRIFGLFSPILLVCATGFARADQPRPQADVAAVDFSRDVQPILAEHCLRCHGPDKAEAGLNLADRQTALQELESGNRAIVPGKAELGELLRRVASADPEERMPPEGKPLKPAQIDVLRRWIAAGAQYQVHWSFRPLIKPQPPAVDGQAWVRNPIDAFVLVRLEQRKIPPSPAADRYTLIKRAYLDLLGLLPQPDEVQAFVADSSPDAYPRLIDRLLASPHFGERWGRHWLDMARYADSDGYEKDRARPDAYLYRDWVIDALNRDLPFDQFTIEQLAGDLLPDTSPADRIATAFNRQTLTNVEGGVDQEEYRVAAVFDRTDTLGSVWLGLTVGCARCHTHKYDPIAHQEYYRLFAFFNDADEVAARLPVDAKHPEALAAKLRPLEAALEARYRELMPDEQRWEAENRRRIETTPTSPLRVEPVDILAVETRSGTRFLPQKDGSYLAESPSPATVAKNPPKDSAALTDVYTVQLAKVPPELTGLRLETIPDPSLPKQSAGRAANGNFVVSQLRAEIVDIQGKVVRAVALQRATADFEQGAYKAADALSTTANKLKGWAVLPKTAKPHYLQVRTTQPLTLSEDQRLQVVIEQHFGARHTLGRFRLRAVTGDVRDLSLPDAVVQALKMYPEKRIYETRQRLFDFFMGQDSQVRQFQAKINAVNAEFQARLMPVRLIATTRTPRKTFRFERGDFLSPAEELAPGTLAALPKMPAARGRATRLDLARWLVGPSNPLAPRVAANQVWAKLFGAGIVRTVGDFGVRGETPSHPELLDWLAASYRDDLHWSRKSLLRTIMTSATYRQASDHRPGLVEADPQNSLLYRQNRLRVEGEIVRDLALEVGGLLSPKIGGPSVFPPMPPDLAKLSYANNFNWTDSTGDDRYRRTMYTFFKRTIPYPTLMTFDCPDANVACVNRTVSNTPLQALALLNNEAFVEAAQSLVKRLLATTGRTDEQRLNDAIRICLVRPPHGEEIDRLDNLLDHARRYYRDEPTAADAMMGRLTLGPVANDEGAAWVATVRVLTNLDEFITRE